MRRQPTFYNGVPNIGSLLLLVMIIIPSVSTAAGNATAFSETLTNNIRMVQHLALNPLLAKAVKQQNSQDFSLEKAKLLNSRWQEFDNNGELKLALSEGIDAEMIRQFIERNSAFEYAILTDQNGSTVAAYPEPDQYWYGSEDSWLHTYNDGKGQVFISPIELDEKTKKYVALVAAPVLDRAQTVGVLTVGISLK